jgi:hypothetical protein
MPDIQPHTRIKTSVPIIVGSGLTDRPEKIAVLENTVPVQLS